MAKRQMLRNSISWKGDVYEIRYFVELDGQETQIGSFSSKTLAEIIACRELLANLPTLTAKLEALENLDKWFQEQLKKLDERVKSAKTTGKAKKAKSEEDKDKVLRDFLAKLGK